MENANRDSSRQSLGEIKGKDSTSNLPIDDNSSVYSRSAQPPSAFVQHSFSLRASSTVKTVHLLGSWDNYITQLPLSHDKAGVWKGTFKFRHNTLQAGQRYWYYIINGYYVTHDPSQASTEEPTTKRILNILIETRYGTLGATAVADLTSRSSETTMDNSDDAFVRNAAMQQIMEALSKKNTTWLLHLSKQLSC